VIQASRSLLAVFVGTFGFALVAKLTSAGFLCAGLEIPGGPIAAIPAEMPSVFAFSTSIGRDHVGGPPVMWFDARNLSTTVFT